MVVSGVVSMGASVIVASKQTLKVEEALVPHVESLEKIQDGLDTGGYTGNYNKKMAAKDRGTVYGRVAIDMTKIYFVPGVLFIGGACLVFGGHRIMLKRNATLAIAFTSLQKAYNAYRSNVRETFGEGADRAMAQGYIRTEKIDDDGRTVMEPHLDWGATGGDPYNRIFGQGETTQWTEDLGVNKIFVQNQQRMAQIRLGHQGHLYLSDVYKALGFPETDISRVVGWKETVNPDGSKSIPVVDFGLDHALPDDWKWTKDAAIYLDFNCMGLIIGGKVQKALEKA